MPPSQKNLIDRLSWKLYVRGWWRLERVAGGWKLSRLSGQSVWDTSPLKAWRRWKRVNG